MNYFKDLEMDNVNVGGFTIDDALGAVNNQTFWTWPHYCTKSAREQVQDEILAKMADAIERNDLKKAKELAKLAKAIKEL